VSDTLQQPTTRARSRRAETWSALLANRLAAAGLIVLLLLVLAAVFADVIAPYAFTDSDLTRRLQPPSTSHWFGTDELGRDVLSRVIYGARVSLQVGAVAVGISLVLGTTIGLVAGYRGGWIDAVLMRAMDILFSFPVVLLAIAIVAVLSPSLVNTMIAIGIVFTPIFARVVRGSVLAVRE
jgi:peptide/nickel transport system permease protein